MDDEVESAVLAANTSFYTDLSLADRFAPLLPKEGERVQDQRFIVPIDFDYRANRTDEEIRKLAEAEYNKRLQGAEFVKRLIQPIAALVSACAAASPPCRIGFENSRYQSQNVPQTNAYNRFAASSKR